VNELNGSELQGAEKEAAKKFSFTARAKLQPVASAIGAIAAQEAVKAVSGKFSPIKQWWYVCLQECLPVNPITDAKIADNRYASQIAAFGQGFQDKMLKQKWFLVGSGAIGCELLKNFAMMGLGNLIITDMDTIERSNLNRQFLFRSWDVGKHKASAAAEVVMRMNPDMKVEAQNNRVGEDSQDVYNDEFMESLDGVANALDNGLFYNIHSIELGLFSGCTTVHGQALCLLRQTSSRVWNSWNYGQHSDRYSKGHRVVRILSRSAREIHSYLHAEKLPKCY
jgi:ubiquitin-activating enzyme E1